VSCDQCLSAFMYDEISAFIYNKKKNLKYVNNTKLHVAAPQGIGWFGSSCRIVLTFIPILLSLTLVEQGNDAEIAQIMHERGRVDEKNLRVLSARGGQRIPGMQRVVCAGWMLVKIHLQEDENKDRGGC